MKHDRRNFFLSFFFPLLLSISHFHSLSLKFYKCLRRTRFKNFSKSRDHFEMMTSPIYIVTLHVMWRDTVTPAEIFSMRVFHIEKINESPPETAPSWENELMSVHVFWENVNTRFRVTIMIREWPVFLNLLPYIQTLITIKLQMWQGKITSILSVKNTFRNITKRSCDGKLSNSVRLTSYLYH